MSSKYHTLICMYIYVLYIKSLSVNKLRFHLHTHQYIFSYLSSLLCYSITAYQSSLKWWACLSFTRWMSCISASKNDYWAWASYISTYYKWCNLNKRYWCDQDDSRAIMVKMGIKKAVSWNSMSSVLLLISWLRPQNGTWMGLISARFAVSFWTNP